MKHILTDPELVVMYDHIVGMFIATWAIIILIATWFAYFWKGKR